MGMQIRRKLYPRGGSFETTIPSQLLFAIDPSQKYAVVFSYNTKDNNWSIGFEPQKSGNKRKRRKND